MTDMAVQENKPAHPLVVVRNFLEARVEQIKTALPAHISKERFVRTVLTACQINPDLLACDRQSLWNACLRCASDGLLPDGQEAALVPYKNKVTYIAMYQGLLKKFRNSGTFKWITAGIVFEGDEYEHWIDETGEHFRHVPGDESDTKKIRRIYALATTKDGGSFICDMNLKEVQKRQAMSRATREDAPWKQWPQEMMKKTALRQLSKYLPKSSDIDALMQRDEAALLGIESLEDRRLAVAAGAVSEGAVGALDHFAQQDEELPGEGSGGETPAQQTQTEPAARESAAEAEAGAATVDLVGQAYEQGKMAKIRGVQRRAVPPQYHAPEASAQANAWIKGWDGAPL